LSQFHSKIFLNPGEDTHERFQWLNGVNTCNVFKSHHSEYFQFRNENLDISNFYETKLGEILAEFEFIVSLATMPIFEIFSEKFSFMMTEGKNNLYFYNFFKTLFGI